MVCEESTGGLVCTVEDKKIPFSALQKVMVYSVVRSVLESGYKRL